MTDPLSTGDSLSYSVSTQVKHDGHEAWVKFEATSQVREGEAGEEARYRISDFVHQQVSDAVEEIMAS